MVRFATVLMLAGLLAGGSALAQTPAKDQTQLPQSEDLGVEPNPQPPAAGEQPQPPEAQPPAESGEDLTEPPPPEPDDQSDTEETSPDDLSFGEIPDVTVIELTDDIARRSIDALALVRDKYKDANLENYESWQDFVDKTDEGKKFEADIKAAGFANVDEWNIAVTSVSFAYSAITDNLADDLAAQIAEIEKDTSLAQDMKDRMIKGLKAMIPSENNKKIVQAMIDDPDYTEKLRLLAEEGE
ncbi:hypothetical protein [Taklimakanibacter lacteus]|uniref:hypothetical protein n=1 Tax=Taklimakanibacter lacteus TaxID=2268456 RepID=UPI0013C4FD06